MKDTKNIFLKIIVWSITGFAGYYIGDNLVSGESLATLENILAGGSIGVAQSLLLALMLFKNYLPEKTAESLETNIIPAVAQVEQRLEGKIANVENVLNEVLQLLVENKELRDSLLNQDSE